MTDQPVIEEAEQIPMRARQLMQELKDNPLEGEDYTEYESGEDRRSDNPYLATQPSVEMVKEFQKHPHFDNKAMTVFKGPLSQVHSNTFYKDEDINVLMHGFELLSLYSEFKTRPKDIDFERDVEVENVRMHFYGSIRQSVGDTTERRNNRVLLSAQPTQLPPDIQGQRWKFFGSGGKK